MSAQTLTQVDPQQFFPFPSTNATGGQRLDTKVSGVADFRAVNYTSHTKGDIQAVDMRAKYTEY